MLISWIVISNTCWGCLRKPYTATTCFLNQQMLGFPMLNNWSRQFIWVENLIVISCQVSDSWIRHEIFASCRGHDLMTKWGLSVLRSILLIWSWSPVISVKPLFIVGLGIKMFTSWCWISLRRVCHFHMYMSSRHDLLGDEASSP